LPKYINSDDVIDCHAELAEASGSCLSSRSLNKFGMTKITYWVFPQTASKRRTKFKL